MYIILHCSSFFFSCKFHVTNLSRDISDVFLEIQEFVQDWRMIDEKSGAQQQQNIAVKATCDLFSSACDPFEDLMRPTFMRPACWIMRPACCSRHRGYCRYGKGRYGNQTWNDILTGRKLPFPPHPSILPFHSLYLSILIILHPKFEIYLSSLLSLSPDNTSYGSHTATCDPHTVSNSKQLLLLQPQGCQRQ